MMEAEPKSDAEARKWIGRNLQDGDPLHAIYTATERHRVAHRCEAYASSNGSLLGVLARSSGARRMLEVGTALGYSAAWLAFGAPEASVDTIEADPGHAELARAEIQRVGLAAHVRVLVGESPGALAGLTPGCDLIFYDARIPGVDEFEAFRALLRSGGLLVTSNLFLGVYDGAMPGLERGADTRGALLDRTQWLTTFSDLKALSIRL
jgi:predicted O-methyltransferase YrrM